MIYPSRAVDTAVSVTARQRWRLALASTFATGLVIAAALTASPASASEVPSVVTSQSLSSYTFTNGSVETLDFTWAVPDSAQSGDTFTITLPPQLTPRNTATFALLTPAPDNQVVANAVWSGNTATFTLTPYVDNHTGVNGTGYFSVQISSGTGLGDYDVNLGGTVERITVIAGETGPVAPTQDAWKGAWWAHPDQGTSITEGALYWGIWLPADADGIAGPVVIADVLGPGQKMDCATYSIEGTAPGDANVSYTLQQDFPARILGWVCNDAGFTLTLDQILPGEKLTVVYTVTITDMSLATYSNEATISNVGKVGTGIQRDSAGGTGAGVIVTPPTVAPPTTVTPAKLAPTGAMDAAPMLFGGVLLLLIGAAVLTPRLRRR